MKKKVSRNINRNKVLKILSIIFLYILAIIGIVFGSINIGENNSKKGYYGDTYVMSFSVDASNEKSLKNDADNFSNWLLYKNISNSGVQYQLDQNGNGYIWTQLTNVSQISSNGNNLNEAPEWAALNTVNSSRVDIYQYNTGATDSNQNLPDSSTSYETVSGQGSEKYTKVLDSSNFDYDSATADTRTSDNSYGVQVNLKSGLNINGLVNDSSSSISWIVIQNVDVLLAKLNIAKWVVAEYDHVNTASNNVPKEEQIRINNLYNTMDSDLQTWANTAYGLNGSIKNTDPISEKNLLYLYEQSKTAADSSSSSDNTSSSATTSTDSDPNANKTLSTIVDKYVLGTITNSNFKNWFPSYKDPQSGTTSSSSSSSDSQTQLSTFKTSLQDNIISTQSANYEPNDSQTEFSFQPSSADESHQNDLIYQFKNTVLNDSLFPEIVNNQYKDTTIQDQNFYNTVIGNAWIQQPFLEKSVTTMSAYEATFLASGVILLIVAIIVSILYRIPGLFGAFSTISAFGLSASLFVLLGINFSIPAVLGLFTSVMISVFSISLFMERLRKLFANKNSVFDSLQTSLKKSMMTIVDINVSVIIFGLSIFFLGKGEISDFGMTLILAPIITLASTFIFFLYPVYCVSDFTSWWKNSIYIWQIKKQAKYKINFKTNYWWIGWLIALVIGIISIALISTIGVTNSSAFNNSGSTIYILYDQPNLENQIMSSLTGTWNNVTSGPISYGEVNDNITGTISPITYSIVPNTDELYVLSATSTNSYDWNTIYSELNKISGFQDFYLTNNSSAFNNSIATSAIYGVLAAYGFLSIYYILRLNVFSIIPIFIVNVFSSLMSISICYLTYMFIDSFFVYAMIFSSIISTLTTCMFISVTKTEFNKKKIHDKEQTKEFIKNSMVGVLNIMFIISVINSLTMIILAIFISPTTVWMFVYIIFGTLASSWFAYYGIPHLYYYSLVLRLNYVNNVINSIDKKINTRYDEVDEELVVSINKFE